MIDLSMRARITAAFGIVFAVASTALLLFLPGRLHGLEQRSAEQRALELSQAMVLSQDGVVLGRWGAAPPQAFDLSELQAKHDANDRLLAAALLGLWLLGLAVSWVTGTLLVRPLHRLTEEVRSFRSHPGQGKLTGESYHRNEVQILTQTFAAMLNRIGLQVSELEQQKQRALAAEEAAHLASKAKSQFLATMSHELRTPLNAIIGYAEILMEDAEPKTDLTDLERIRTSGLHLLGLINDVLDLSKVEAGHLKLIPEDIDLDKLLAEIVESTRPLAKARENQLIVDSLQPAGKVYGDPMRMRQVLLNLLSNACKFTHRGTVRIEVRREASATGEHIVFAIHDTGIGISESQLARLFRPFVQADDTTSRRFGGSGLGLVLSQRLARMMEGDVTVRSVVGEGSTFSLILPARSARDEVAKLTDERLREALDKTLPSVLCIDDEPAALILLDRMLTTERLHVVPCLDPSRAVALATALQPIVITIDMRMPGTDGTQLVEQLRSRPSTEHLPIIMVTADTEREATLALGIQGWLSKPIDRSHLIRTLSTLGWVGTGPVLVVEDDPGTQDVLVRTLDRQGIRTLTAGNGIEALAVLETAHPKLILLDLMMPEMDGFTLAARLRADPIRAEIPIVVLTAATLDAQHREQLASCAGIVQKGADPAGSLVETIRKLAQQTHRVM